LQSAARDPSSHKERRMSGMMQTPMRITMERPAHKPLIIEVRKRRRIPQASTLPRTHPPSNPQIDG
jgi:hypothetical protein